MISVIIKVNGKYYAGEDHEKCYKTAPKIGGRYNYNSGEVNVLNFTKDKDGAKVIEGNINLKSEIDRILRCIRDGYIQMDRIEIIRTEEEVE
ncbi:hypothetical protein [Thermoactinomyces vulgaris]|jgi:hypothetical protein|uniref:hypothetical protein n=1 Tax=Thermoactinomyces vulgaris TaxID=2026 RepID=UPI00363D9327